MHQLSAPMPLNSSIQVADARASAGTQRRIDCCDCPTLDIGAVQHVSAVFRNAMERVFNDTWFLASGSLLASLRYGENVRRLRSGKVNLVDSDVDVVVLVNRNQREAMVAKLMSHLPGWKNAYWSQEYTPNGSWHIDSPYDLPKSCAPGSGPGKPFNADMGFIDTDGGKLFVEGGLKEKLKNFAPDGIVPRDLILPLRKSKWAGGVAQVPNDVMKVIYKQIEPEITDHGDPRWPVEKHLAGPELQPEGCPCALDQADRDEIEQAAKELHEEGFASFWDFDVSTGHPVYRPGVGPRKALIQQVN